jgi:reactive chlorine resistance protein C
MISSAREARLAQLVQSAAPAVLRFTLVFLILLWGVFKFFEFEAVAIKPLVENSPFLGWLYPLLGVRGTSAAIGVVEVVVGLLIAMPRVSPRISAWASLAAAGMFLTTLSFLFTTPDGFSGPFTGFLMKDLVLLGAALVTAAQSFSRTAAMSPSY